MKDNTKREIEEIDILLAIIGIFLLIMYVDYIDINERFGFPVNVLDEPALLVAGIIFGYLLAKFRLLEMLKKLF